MLHWDLRRFSTLLSWHRTIDAMPYSRRLRWLLMTQRTLENAESLRPGIRPPMMVVVHLKELL